MDLSNINIEGKHMLIAGGVLLLGIGCYFAYKHMKNNSNPSYDEEEHPHKEFHELFAVDKSELKREFKVFLADRKERKKEVIEKVKAMNEVVDKHLAKKKGVTKTVGHGNIANFNDLAAEHTIQIPIKPQHKKETG